MDLPIFPLTIVPRSFYNQRRLLCRPGLYGKYLLYSTLFGRVCPITGQHLGRKTRLRHQRLKWSGRGQGYATGQSII
jgi:hypothetical protein